jgi:hypothetical protein
MTKSQHIRRGRPALELGCRNSRTLYIGESIGMGVSLLGLSAAAAMNAFAGLPVLARTRDAWPLTGGDRAQLAPRRRSHEYSAGPCGFPNRALVRIERSVSRRPIRRMTGEAGAVDWVFLN